jgi:hypothetical protein
MAEEPAEAPALSHFTTISNGVFVRYSDAHRHGVGESAFMGLKVWAKSAEHAARITADYSERVGFRVTRTVEVHPTPPLRPCRERPGVYDLQFTLYNPPSASEPKPES